MLADVMYERASFSERLIAFIIDFLFLRAFYLAFNLVDLKVSFLLLFLLYFSVFDGIAGGSFGKAVMGLKVVNSRGESIGFFRGFLRTAFFFVSIALLRPVHDTIIGAIVVKGEDL
ncbi:hypothetical protein TST_1726 [Thermosulfidibacter takaii ABI70S6]|uniref:RDD domain-containing protein n=1 Tax=Thermosulfidibacter takaii (strain DSM 17441 / JCM 13301 / NBRC 103674 / ABI70S6) TaxID=1298851 RepID=A0A0S3QVZ7_THET7|nr:RDD family protein [Thermosulfidibacter takaii]BAT72510.1 hypothetical protein TST_1726 [Thermosulfidibacter takaii ABI70S6]